MGLNMFTCLSLLGLVTLINGRFIFPLSPIETSTGLSADYYLRGKPLSSSSLESSSSSPSIESKDDLESSHASPVGTRSSTGRSYERIQETTYQPAEPYNFGYDVRDDYGNRQYRKEESDASGAVRGSYGYTDANGLFRIVEYIADANGFRANIKTNEPGTAAQQAADIILSAESPPRAIVEAASAPKPVTEEAPKEVIKKQSESVIRGSAYDRLNRPSSSSSSIPVEPTYLYRTALPLPSTPTSSSSSSSVSTSSSSSSSSPSSSPSTEIEKERQ
ncbi:uncharacterized protein DDB_G0271670-like [Panonychus citri]|uniref:uncharacterized protein DDB_G0271670-like n=1 Tax=Panonychus citri TaxID=50023 RepID=UPI00230777DF|nr:uncharacterized protein DDB_G0271670-like [Panonychus citri]